MPCLKPQAPSALHLPPAFLRATLLHLRGFPGASATGPRCPRAAEPARCALCRL